MNYLSFFRNAVLLVCAAGFLAAGCSLNTGAIDLRDENHPLMQRALSRKRANDMEGAIQAFQSALDSVPNLARAHLELGLLYDQNRQDYVRAIYHYQRYIEMRPKAEKRKYVEEMIQYAKYSFAASLPDRPSEAMRMIAQLKEENSALQLELKNTLSKSDKNSIPPPERDAPPLPGTDLTKLEPLIPQFTATQKTVVVQRGDTLSSISVRVYGDSGQWQRIFDANRALLVRPDNVSPGQTLVIPPVP